MCTDFWAIGNTVLPLLEAAASNSFDKILAHNLRSKNCVLLRLLFKGGFYLRAASNRVAHFLVENQETGKEEPGNFLQEIAVFLENFLVLTKID